MQGRTMLDLKKAEKELQEKTYLEIQKSTAYVWASRAIVAYQNGLKEKTLRSKIGWLMVGGEYEHEAIEHASLCEDGGKLVHKIANVTMNSRNHLAANIETAIDKKA
jgi:hypothetical protein